MDARPRGRACAPRAVGVRTLAVASYAWTAGASETVWRHRSSRRKSSCTGRPVGHCTVQDIDGRGLALVVVRLRVYGALAAALEGAVTEPARVTPHGVDGARGRRMLSDLNARPAQHA